MDATTYGYDMSEVYPEFANKTNPTYFFEVDGRPAMVDAITRSRFNLETASMAIIIIENAVINKGIPTSAFGVITTYNANVDVCRYAFYRLNTTHPGMGFDTVPVNSCGDFQGGQHPCIVHQRLQLYVEPSTPSPKPLEYTSLALEPTALSMSQRLANYK